MSVWTKHKILETNVIYLFIAALIVISIGGLVEIVPLFYLKNTIESVDGVRPYTPLELAGRDIYVREGCYLCHSQMIRPLRDEVERYGHYSLAAESMYDRPFQWGSKRTGPDLARVGGKYSDAWHQDHLRDPRSVVPGSIMPNYDFLERADLDYAHIADKLRIQADLGVPYTPDDIAWRSPTSAPRTRPTAPAPPRCRRAIPRRTSATSTAIPAASAKPTRSSPTCRCSAPRSTSSSTTTKPTSAEGGGTNGNLYRPRPLRPVLGAHLFLRRLLRRRGLRHVAVAQEEIRGRGAHAAA